MAASFRRLIPAGGDCDAHEALSGWREEKARDPKRPRIAVNMVSSVDGRVAIDGRSAPLSSPADRELFHALRAEADAVMAGAGTVRTERYGPIIRDSSVRKRRRAAGLAEQPIAVVVSNSLVLDPELPLLADPDSHVVILGPSSGGKLPGAAATMSNIRCATLAEGLIELRSRFDVELVLCEGGPTLVGSLVDERVIDELFLSRSPQLVGGAPGPTIVAGSGEAEPQRLDLRMLLAHGDSLFARYVVA
jgi:riboflavin biosynthesis pyrimidine reductase